MDRIDALGNTNRSSLFTKELLSETNDTELQEIVKKASVELKSPIALVSLILDQVQFFKAHIGLPPALELSRGTNRDASFCQFVVRDGKTFEVKDAPNDPRIPQHVVKEYNIKSYLGVPIMFEENVMGSLCVLDTKKRDFSKEEHKSLNDLAQLVNERLKVIKADRLKSKFNLTETTILSALKELSNSLKNIDNLVKYYYSANTSLRTFINHSNYIFLEKPEYSEALLMSLKAAKKAVKENENSLIELELEAKDGLDCINALEGVMSDLKSTKLSEVLFAAQDLCRSSTNLIGGFPLPDFRSNLKIHTKGNFTIAVISNCILLLSSELSKLGSKEGIKLKINENSRNVDLLFSSTGLNEKLVNETKNKLQNLIGIELPTLKIDVIDNALKLTFLSINTKNSCEEIPELKII